MEFRQLRYFTAIVEAGSITRASRTLFVAQSALSSQMSQLEAEVGARLLDRAPTGVTLSAEGRRFHAHAVAILRQIGEAKASVGADEPSPSGIVLLGIPQSVAAVLALPVLVAARRDLPNVDLRITEGLTSSLSKELRIGRLDLAVLYGSEGAPDIWGQPVLTEELCLVRRPACRTGRVRASISLLEALSGPLVLPSVPNGVRMIVDFVAQQHDLVPSIVAEINSLALLKGAVVMGMGATILPRATVEADLRSGDLEALTIEQPKLVSALGVYELRAVRLSRAAAHVKRLVTNVARGLCRDSAWPGAEVAFSNEQSLSPQSHSSDSQIGLPEPWMSLEVLGTATQHELS
ncbi:LysR substrate-binding domain-containing protein [Rhizobacter sp. Root404]|uniref:LysR family transcriptional regulator n=1 Tax=Rhizobacter sp. Root404 TaxID=1736528 RepID=UPI0009EA438A